MFQEKFQHIWFSCFRGEDFKDSTMQPEAITACDSHVSKTTGTVYANVIRGHPTDTYAPGQVSVHLAQWFQRRFNGSPLRTHRRRTPSDDKSLHGHWPGKIKSF